MWSCVTKLICLQKIKKLNKKYEGKCAMLKAAVLATRRHHQAIQSPVVTVAAAPVIFQN